MFIQMQQRTIIIYRNTGNKNISQRNGKALLRKSKLI